MWEKSELKLTLHLQLTPQCLHIVNNTVCKITTVLTTAEQTFGKKCRFGSTKTFHEFGLICQIVSVVKKEKNQNVCLKTQNQNKMFHFKQNTSLDPKWWVCFNFWNCQLTEKPFLHTTQLTPKQYQDTWDSSRGVGGIKDTRLTLGRSIPSYRKTHTR